VLFVNVRENRPFSSLIVGDREIRAINCKLLTNFPVDKRRTRLGKMWVGPESARHQEAVRSETLTTPPGSHEQHTLAHPLVSQIDYAPA
jgi:hypothetical protein